MGGEEFAVLGRAVKTRGQVFARGAYGLQGWLQKMPDPPLSPGACGLAGDRL